MKNVKRFTKAIICFSLLTCIYGCSENNKTLQVNYLREGELKTETIPLDFIGEKGEIVSPYIETVKFSYLDSVNYENNNPDREIVFSTPYALDFTKEIAPYSPEYYTAYVVYNVNKAIGYYNKLFGGKIDFNSQEKHRHTEVSFGDVTLFTTPKTYILEENSNPSPSIFFHEVGHRAFWYLQDSVGIKFKGLSYIHMGLLEYFTVSLNNSPVVGEDMLPSKTIRNAAWEYGYPPADSLRIGRLVELLKESYPEKIKDPNSNISKYLDAFEETYSNYYHVLDNHRGGMIITSTLWRIREKLEQDVTDKLVAQTILNLNHYMSQRADFYQPEEGEKMPDKIEWYDLYYGLIAKDKELNNGKGKDIIEKSFAETGFEVTKVKV